MLLLGLNALLLMVKRFLMKNRRRRKKNLKTTARSPTQMKTKTPSLMTPKMMMSRRLLCSFHSLFGT
jgi:hypothetical protein